MQPHGLSVSGRTSAHAPPLGLSRMPQGSGISPNLGLSWEAEEKGIPFPMSHWMLGDEEFFFFFFFDAVSLVSMVQQLPYTT